MARLEDSGIDRQEWESSFARSIGRRHLGEKRRRNLKRQRLVLVIPALAGLVMLLVWIAQPLPYQQWGWAAIGAALAIPLFAFWNIDLRNKEDR